MLRRSVISFDWARPRLPAVVVRWATGRSPGATGAVEHTRNGRNATGYCTPIGGLAYAGHGR